MVHYFFSFLVQALPDEDTARVEMLLQCLNLFLLKKKIEHKKNPHKNTLKKTKKYIYSQVHFVFTSFTFIFSSHTFCQYFSLPLVV